MNADGNLATVFVKLQDIRKRNGSVRDHGPGPHVGPPRFARKAAHERLAVAAFSGADGNKEIAFYVSGPDSRGSRSTHAADRRPEVPGVWTSTQPDSREAGAGGGPGCKKAAELGIQVADVAERSGDGGRAEDLNVQREWEQYEVMPVPCTWRTPRRGSQMASLHEARRRQHGQRARFRRRKASEVDRIGRRRR